MKKKGKEILKKNIKKCFALLLAVVMTLTMAMTVSAKIEGVDTLCDLIILDGKAKATNTYNVYKIAGFDVETDSEKNKVYTNISVGSPYKNIFKPNEVKKETKDSDYMVALSNSLAKAADASTLVAENVTTGMVEDLPTGYYLIKEIAHKAEDIKLATKYILVAVDNATTTVTLKTSEASITKKIVLEGTENTKSPLLVDKNVVAVNDTVNYQIDSTIPEYPSYATDIKYIITDTMSVGLTPCEASKVKVFIWSTNKYVECPTDKITVNVNGQVITVSLDSDYVVANPGGSIRVTLSGALNTNANIGATGNPNSVDLTYTNNWDENTTHKTPEDTVITYTGQLAIEKVDSVNSEKKLAGAVFAVYAPKQYTTNVTLPTGVSSTISPVEGTTYYYYQTVTTDENGKATIDGLDKGTYYAVETKAPAGYSVDSTPRAITLTVASNPTTSEDNLEKGGDTVTPSGNSGTESNSNVASADANKVTWNIDNDNPIQITNTKGLTLPGTGGIGTTLFTFGGIALILIAGVMFIVYTRKQKKQS